MSITARLGLSAAAFAYDRIGDKPVIKNSIYESTFLAIMGPMKPVSDVLCSVYSSKLIDEPNKKRIEELIRRISSEIQTASGIVIPNADDWITLLLSICKGKTCEICEKKLEEISATLTSSGMDAESLKTNANVKIAKILTSLDSLVGRATDTNSFLSKLLAKYREKVNKVRTTLKESLTINAILNCIRQKQSPKETDKAKATDKDFECFTELNTISNGIQNDPDLKKFYDKIKEIQNMLSPQPPQVGGKTRRRRLMRSRRRGTMRNRRRHQHSSQQSKHKNKREQH